MAVESQWKLLYDASWDAKLVLFAALANCSMTLEQTKAVLAAGTPSKKTWIKWKKKKVIHEQFKLLTGLSDRQINQL